MRRNEPYIPGEFEVSPELAADINKALSEFDFYSEKDLGQSWNMAEDAILRAVARELARRIK